MVSTWGRNKYAQHLIKKHPSAELTQKKKQHPGEIGQGKKTPPRMAVFLGTGFEGGFLETPFEAQVLREPFLATRP